MSRKDQFERRLLSKAVETGAIDRRLYKLREEAKKLLQDLRLPVLSGNIVRVPLGYPNSSPEAVLLRVCHPQADSHETISSEEELRRWGASRWQRAFFMALQELGYKVRIGLFHPDISSKYFGECWLEATLAEGEDGLEAFLATKLAAEPPQAAW